MPQGNKLLRVMAGPNGSGKSTIISKIYNTYRSGPFVNADLIHSKLSTDSFINLFEEYKIITDRQEFDFYLAAMGTSWVKKAVKDGVSLEFDKNTLRVPSSPSSYDSAIAADFIRYQLLKIESTFTFETVLSHQSKVDFLNLAKDEGYSNYLYFICTVSPKINIQRVAKRVKEGGHDVPTDKIISRYYSSLAILPELIKSTHRTFLFDNSSPKREESIKPIAEIEDGYKLKILKDDIPLKTIFPGGYNTMY